MKRGLDCNCLRNNRHGLTLIEAIGACVVVAVLGVAVLRGVAAVGVSRATMADRAMARQLADGLMADIVSLPYSDPDSLLGLGIEVNELLSSKNTFDDVDDFDGWSETTPTNQSNGVITGLNGFGRSVEVKRVDLATGNSVSLVETGLKRITVRVTKNGKPLAERIALRADVSE